MISMIQEFRNLNGVKFLWLTKTQTLKPLYWIEGLELSSPITAPTPNQRRRWHPTPVLLPGKSMDGGAWWAAVHGVAKSRTRLSDFTFAFYFHALEKEMATHSSILAWRIPGMGEPGGLPSMGSHSQTWLKRLSSSSSIHHPPQKKWASLVAQQIASWNFNKSYLLRTLKLPWWLRW